MSPAAVVVVGAGYAGVAAVQALQDANGDFDLTWISADAHHEVKHEIHRVIRTPELADGLAIPIAEMTAPDTTFHEGRVVGIDPEERTVQLASDETVPFDYLVLTVGARTAFYGIPGMQEHALLLERIDDALAINERLRESPEPRVVIGGGGLSGIQSAGEIDEMDVGAEVTVVEALDRILPRTTEPLQDRARAELDQRRIRTVTGSPIVEVNEDEVVLDGEEAIPYDLLLWTGGITGRAIDHGDTLEEERNRITVDRTLATSDERIFACGDAAVIEQPEGVAPASAQAAWQAGPIAARNVIARLEGRPLREFTYQDKGTLISVGETAIAHDVVGIPIETFGSIPAKTLKKFVAARWIADASSYSRALRLWSGL